MRDLTTLAKYPFLNEAKKYIKDNGPTISVLLEGLLYERARTIGIERLENALKNGDVGNRSLAGNTDSIMEIFSYPLARMITVSVDNTYFKKRYALAEAIHAYRNLLNERPLFLIEVSEELLINAEYIENSGRVKVFFKDYLRNAPTRYNKWKMVNRDMDNGYVNISIRDFTRLILEALKLRIEKELDSRKSNKTIEKAFSSDIKRFQKIVNIQIEKMEAVPVGKLSIEKLPPCMENLLTAIQAGTNVSHMGRFSLVSFLNSLQLSTNEILKLFSNAPDYQEERTRYQVEHISGTSSSTSYKSPGCDKMRTYGICPVDRIDELCRGIRHPLSYYSAKWKKEKNRK